LFMSKNGESGSWSVESPNRKFGRSRLSLVMLLTFLCCSGLAVAGASKTLTVRVDSRSGAPCLVVNGKPVRARMFFGGPGAAPIKIGPVGRKVEFEFVAQNEARDTGTLHFRFGQFPGDVFIDNIHIEDIATGKEVTPVSDFESGPGSFSKDWTYWPPGAANTVGTVTVEGALGEQGSAGLHVQLRPPPDGKWPDWHVYHLPNLAIARDKSYRVSFWARAEPARDITVALYRPGNPFIHLGGPSAPFGSQIRMAASAGVDFVSFPIEMPWPAPGQVVDWQGVDNACAQVLRANSNALLLPRFGADPPEWWRKANPGEVMTWEDGSQQQHAVVASPLYRRDAAARVTALVEHLEGKFGAHMAGYHPCGQNTGEWFYQDTWENKLNGYAPGDTNAWRGWLRDRYKNDTALRAAWGNPTAELDSAVIPSTVERRGSPYGVIREPDSEKSVIDFAEFQQQAMADLVCELAHAARQASHGRKLVVFFYGYLFEFGSIRLGPSTCGHYALRRVLDCPDIDVLCSPISYFDRGIGGSAPVMTAAESVALAGKMWLCEDDTRTYLGSGAFPGEFDGGKDLAETQTLLRRNVAEEVTRNFATWWMDLGMTGWFDDPRLWEDMKRFDAVDRIFLKKPIPFRPEVAAIIDPQAMLETAATGWMLTEPGIYQVRRPLGRMGAPYGQYLLDDAVRGRVRAKLYVFLNAWQLSAAQRQALHKNTRGSCRVWCYAPGLHDGLKTSPEAMRDISGFRLQPAFPKRVWATPTASGKQLGLETAFGVDAPVTPLYAAADATPEETLATYPDGSAAVALRHTSEGWSMFVGIPGLTSELLRIAARKAGVHLFTGTDCNVYANGPIVALHASQDGVVTLDTGRRGKVHDALDDSLIGDGPRFNLPLKKGETRVFRY
jgi:beta-galactosidase